MALLETTTMDDIDRISARVTIAALFGALAGVGTSLLQGHVLSRTVVLTAGSCAMVATGLLVPERIASKLLPPTGNPWEHTLSSHALGGFFGGSLLGALYKKRPTQGALFFVPVMLLVGTGEQLFADLREEQIQRYHREKRRLEQESAREDLQ